MYSSLRSLRHATLALCASTVLLAAAHAAGPVAPADAQARYQKEVAVCNTGKSNQDRATCMKEAGAARDEAKRQRLESGQSPATLRANALARCEVQPPADREACRARIEGAGTASGTPASGGIYRELVQREVIVPPAAPTASQSSK